MGPTGRLLNHVGLARPYRFERTLVALAAVGLALVVVAIWTYLDFRRQTAAGSPRTWYFIYVLGLLAAAVTLARLPRLATVLVSLAALEFGLGIGSLIFFKFGMISDETLMPATEGGMISDWHPLLQARLVPTPPGHVDPTWAINSERTRGKERDAGDLQGKSLVALFGGSSTFDAHREGLSWPDRLQQILGPHYEVVNHGMAGYTSADHVLQTAFYDRTKGVSPRCSVYYVGWNDLRTAHIANLDPAYADYYAREQIDSLRARRSGLHNSISPVATYLGRLAGLAFDTARHGGLPKGTASGEPDPALEEIFARNVATISAINRQRGIRTIWIGQLMNRTLLTAHTPSLFLAHFVPDSAVMTLIGRLNAILARQSSAAADVYVGLPLEDFHGSAFSDAGHFTQAGSLKFATLLAPHIAENCR